MKYIVVDTCEDLKIACDYFSKKHVIGLDCETTALEPWNGELRLIQLSDGTKTIIIDVRKLLQNEGRRGLSKKANYYLFAALKALLENPEIAVVIHNSQFEQEWLIYWCDISPNRVFDTFLASKNIYYNSENDPEKAHNLGAVGRRFLGVDLDKTEQKSDWGRENLTKEQLDYAALDVYYLPALREVMYQALEDDKLLHAALIDFECVPAFSRMRLRGHCVNRQLYTQEIIRLQELREIASKNLQDVLRPTTGIDLIQPNFFGIEDKDYGDVLLTSHDQVLEALQRLDVPVFAASETDKIAKAERQGIRYAIGTGKKNIAHLSSTYPVVKLLQDFRGLNKQLEAFGPNFLKFLVPDGEGNERVHASYRVFGAESGRTSSAEPNMQQIPDLDLYIGTDKYHVKFREAFTVPKGYKLLNADYSGIELRIMAEFSQDPVFVQAFRSGKDLHAVTASIIHNVEYELCADENHEYYKKYRKPIKSVNFGIAYGQGYVGLAEVLMISEEEAQSIIEAHKEKHPVLWDYLNAQANKAVKTLKARSASGRMQKFTPPQVINGMPDKKEVGQIGRNGKNMPIQGTSADITKTAMTLLDRALQDYDAYIINTVHDEISVEARDDERLPEVKDLIEKCMIEAAQKYIKSIPIEVTAKIMNNWSEK